MIQTGLDVLITEHLELLRGRRVGLVTHPAAVLPDLTSAADALLNAGIRFSALFGPEHGFDGSAADGAAVGDSTDARTGVAVYSLYGPTKEPTPAMLANVDLQMKIIKDELLEIKDKYGDKITFKYVGTLPPFNFVNIEINTGDY